VRSKSRANSNARARFEGSQRGRMRPIKRPPQVGSWRGVPRAGCVLARPMARPEQVLSIGAGPTALPMTVTYCLPSPARISVVAGRGSAPLNRAAAVASSAARAAAPAPRCGRPA
jgi:hypothetical protein